MMMAAAGAAVAGFVGLTRWNGGAGDWQDSCTVKPPGHFLDEPDTDCRGLMMVSIRKHGHSAGVLKRTKICFPIWCMDTRTWYLNLAARTSAKPIPPYPPLSQTAVHCPRWLRRQVKSCRLPRIDMNGKGRSPGLGARPV